MKLKVFALLTVLTSLAISCSISQTPDNQPAVTGNCDNLSCEELLNQLKSKWQKEIDTWWTENNCQTNTKLGLNVWQKEESKVVSLICWGDKESDGNTYGNSLGLLPFPGFESTFGSKWDCQSSQKCENSLRKFRAPRSGSLRDRYPEQIREYEVECGIKAGDLRLLISEENRENKADVQCIFFVPSQQIDSDGDGVSDGEGKPTGVDIILGTLNQRSVTSDQLPVNDER